MSVVVGVPIVLGVVKCFVEVGDYVVRICSRKEATPSRPRDV